MPLPPFSRWLVLTSNYQGRIIDTLYSDTRSVSGLNAHLDYTLLMRSFLGQLDQWRMDWSLVLSEDPGDGSDLLRSNMRGASLPFGSG